jgi:hypothetical protein
MASPPPPENVVATVNANDSISLEWTFDSSSGSVDNYEVQISRDGASFTNPTGGPSSPTGTGPHTYGPNSDKSYNSVVGIDSSFQFRVRAVNTDGTSDWNTSPTVYTDPVPPHNPVVSRPSANEITITATTQADNVVGNKISYREDTGSGYSNWTAFDRVQYTGETDNSVDPTVKGNRWSKTFVVGETYHANYGNKSIQENARYQFKLQTEQTTPERDRWGIRSEYVYADYGNDGNVFFEDDFESGNLDNWDVYSNEDPHSGIQSGSHGDLGINGADQGTYYCRLDYGDDIRLNIGSILTDTDVLVKAVVATGSMDNGSEHGSIKWYDGSNYQDLRTFYHEYNKQGWVEVSAIVPDSYLNSNNRIRFRGYGGTADHFAVDRVVVSDVLHEYTSPAGPSKLTSDAYQSIKDFVNGSTEDPNNWDYIELYDDASNAVTRVSITVDGRCQWLDVDGDKTLQIEFDVTGSDDDIPIPTTLKHSAVWDSESGGRQITAKEQFAKTVINQSGDNVVITHSIDIPR